VGASKAFPHKDGKWGCEAVWASVKALNPTFLGLFSLQGFKTPPLPPGFLKAQFPDPIRYKYVVNSWEFTRGGGVH